MVVRFACHCSLASMHSSALRALECIVGGDQTRDAKTSDAEIGDVGTEKYGQLRNSGVLECISSPRCDKIRQD